MSQSTASLYDNAAGDWARSQPVLLSDYTARPFVLAACEPIAGLKVLDLGCGEGYVARQIAARGSGPIRAYDISAGMIEQARAAEAAQPLGIDYRVGDASGDLDVADDAFDLVIAVFLFNYLDTTQTATVMRTAHRALREGGRFIYTVPHPLLPFFRPKQRPFWFDRGESGYFDGRNVLFEGRIWRRDGADVPVRCVHKTFGDYFEAMNAAGFRRMPTVTELRVTEAHLALDPDFFGPLDQQPLHVMFELTK
jgi:SAM-dependent methyltransferase